MAKRIYLSPSTQYGNIYATGNTNEMVQCEKIAQATAKALKRCGFVVKVGKSGDSMANRCNESDSFNADIHMPITLTLITASLPAVQEFFALTQRAER